MYVILFQHVLIDECLKYFVLFCFITIINTVVAKSRHASLCIIAIITLTVECICAHFSSVWLFVTQCSQPGSSIHGFFRQEYWSGLPYTPPGDLSNPEIEPVLLCPLHWQLGSLPVTPPGKSINYRVIAKCITCTSTNIHIFNVKIDSNICSRSLQWLIFIYL